MYIHIQLGLYYSHSYYFQLLGPVQYNVLASIMVTKGGGVEDGEATGQVMVVGVRRDRLAKRAEVGHLVLSRNR